MSTAARKLADDVLRCPKCGKEISSLCCNHCGSRLPSEQQRLYAALRNALPLGGIPRGKRPIGGDSDDDAEPFILRMSLGSSNDDLVESSTSVNHERYTPRELIALVHKALGQIDLDPASSKEANKVVKAKAIFTKQTDGLKQRWYGRVFLNPPFDDWPTWMAKLDQEIAARQVKQAIMVGPANISAFRPLLKRNGLLFVPDERPKYYDPNSEKLIDPPFGSLMCYVGSASKQFARVFGLHGLVLQPVNC